MPQVEYISKEEAIAAVRQGVFEVVDADSHDFGRKLVHCFLGNPPMLIGADWDEDAVISKIHEADQIAWMPFMGHDLAIRTVRGVYRFQIAKPDSATGGA